MTNDPARTSDPVVEADSGDRVATARREADLDVSPDVAWREVEYSHNDAGERVYRHQILTEWQVLPDA